MSLTLPKKAFFGAAIGSMVEYYDFVLFIMLMPVILPLFFPADSLIQSLKKGYWILMISIFMRPLGGILFGYIGDWMGRRKALLCSMYGIAIATFIMGMVPNYATAGIWSVVVLTFAKSLQILCFGGEYNGAGIYIVEHARDQYEGFIGSLLIAVALLGSLLASIMGVICTAAFMPSWSWRAAFVFGSLIGVLGIAYRKCLPESPNFQQADLKVYSLIHLFKQYPWEIIAGICVGAFTTVPFMTVFTFVNPILLAKGYVTQHQLMWLQTGINLSGLLIVIVSGILSDKKSLRAVMRIGCFLLMILAYPLMWLIDRGHLSLIIFSSICLVMINEILLGPSNAYLKNLFPMQYRYRGASFSFCLGMSIFGGLTPVVENFIYQKTGHFSAISLWLVLIAVGTLLSISRIEKKRLFPLVFEDAPVLKPFIS
jgi:MFS transporter, MHS family, proline/betaine transporter